MRDPFALDKLERCRFGKFHMPYTTMTVSASLRHHVHVYRRVAGGKIEKQARNLYLFKISAEWHTTLVTDPPLWPDCINGIRGLFDAVKTETLVVPTIGEFKAVIVDYQQTTDASVTSGESGVVTLLEEIPDDLSSPFLTVKNAASLAGAANAFKYKAGGLDPRPGLFDQIFAAADKVLAFRDQSLLRVQQVANEIASLTALIEEADATLSLLNDPLNNEVLQALLDMWGAVVALASNPVDEARELRTYTTDRRMSVSEISARIYDGDSSFGPDLMALNFFEDAFSVPAATKVSYFVQ